MNTLPRKHVFETSLLRRAGLEVPDIGTVCETLPNGDVVIELNSREESAQLRAWLDMAEPKLTECARPLNEYWSAEQCQIWLDKWGKRLPKKQRERYERQVLGNLECRNQTIPN